MSNKSIDANTNYLSKRAKRIMKQVEQEQADLISNMSEKEVADHYEQLRLRILNRGNQSEILNNEKV